MTPAKTYTREQIEKALKTINWVTDGESEDIWKALDQPTPAETGFIKQFVENRGTRGHTFIEKAEEEAQLILDLVDGKVSQLQEQINFLSKTKADTKLRY